MTDVQRKCARQIFVDEFAKDGLSVLHLSQPARLAIERAMEAYAAEHSAEAVRAEREACAKVCEGLADQWSLAANLAKADDAGEVMLAIQRRRDVAIACASRIRSRELKDQFSAPELSKVIERLAKEPQERG